MTEEKEVINVSLWLPWQLSHYSNKVADACCAKEHPYQILTEYHLRQGSYKVKCNSDSSSHKTRSVLLFCGPAHTDSLWPVLTRVKSGQAQFDAGQNGPGSQVGLEQKHLRLT